MRASRAATRSASLALDAARLTDAGELSADNLEVNFGGLAAISSVSLTVRRREIFGLIGPNGAGKTTLINCLTGFQTPTSGRVRLAHVNVTGWQPERLRRAGVARSFQAGRLFRDMTVRDNVEVTALAWECHGGKPQQRQWKYSIGLVLPTRRRPSLGPCPIRINGA